MDYFKLLNNDVLSEIITRLNLNDITTVNNIFNISVINDKLFWINKLKVDNLDEYVKFLDIVGELSYIDKYDKILKMSKGNIYIVLDKDIHKELPKLSELKDLIKSNLNVDLSGLTSEQQFVHYTYQSAIFKDLYNNNHIIKILFYERCSFIYKYVISENIPMGAFELIDEIDKSIVNF